MHPLDKYSAQDYNEIRKDVKKMKKLLSVFMALCLLFALFCFHASAEEAVVLSELRIAFSSDLRGLTCEEQDKLCDLKTEGLTFRDSEILISDVGGRLVTEPLKPGRTYNLHFLFVPTEGYALPEAFAEKDVHIDADDGCYIWQCTVATGGGHYCLMINEKVTVRGNLFERIFGFLYDVCLKVVSWSPY